MKESTIISNEDLLRLHESMMIILDEVDRICKKHSIPYFLDSGTALGAVRHGGFIPWDDDMDIGMLRNDYIKFLKIARTELHEMFFLQTYETDSHYYKFNAKIRLNNTFFPENGSKNMAHKGIFIDIFPFDYVSDNRTIAINEIKKARRLFKCVVLSRPDFIPHNMKQKIANRIMRFYGYDRIRNLYISHIMSNNRKPTEHVTCFIYHMIERKNLIFHITDLYPCKTVRFEKKEYMIMNNPDAYLTIMYDKYMQLPAENERVCHLCGKIIFDENIAGG